MKQFFLNLFNRLPDLTRTIKIILYSFIGVAISLIVISFSVFVKHFGESSVSNELDRWGQFGDFFGGVLNPLLAVINICVFVWLTLVIKEFDSKRDQQSIRAQKMIALISIKQQEAKAFIDEMDSLLSLYNTDGTQDWFKLLNCQTSLDNFKSRNTYIFSELYKLKEWTNLIEAFLTAGSEFHGKERSQKFGEYIVIKVAYGNLVKELNRLVII